MPTERPQRAKCGFSPSAGRWKYVQLFITETKAPESQGGNAAMPCCSTISQAFNPLPALPFLWYCSKLDDPANLYGNSILLLAFLLHLKWREFSVNQLNIRQHHSVLHILKHSLQPLWTEPSKRINSEFGPRNIRVVTLFSTRTEPLSFPHLPIFSHFCFLILLLLPPLYANSMMLQLICYQCLEIKAENLREKDTFKNTRV